MLAELFYPKELKKKIIILRQENNLNNKAFSKINSVYDRQILMLIACIIIVYIIFNNIVIFLLPIFLITFVLVDLNISVKNKILPYITGVQKELIFEKYKIYRFGYKYIFKDRDGNVYQTPYLSEIKYNGYEIDTGSIVKCWISKNSSKLCMPEFKSTLETYCLKKSIITDFENTES